MDLPGIDPSLPRPGPPRRTLSKGAIWAIVGAMIVAPLFMAIASYIGRKPELTQQELDAARALWEQKQIKSYDLDLVFSSVQAVSTSDAEIHLEVREGEAVRMTRDNVAHEQPSTRDYWKVENQFRMIQDEIDKRKHYQENSETASQRPITLRAAFHPEFGCPMHFERKGQDSPLHFYWKVNSFVPAK